MENPATSLFKDTFYAYETSLESVSSWLKNADFDNCAKITLKQKREASLLVRGLLRKMLFEQTGEIDWKIKKEESGKPYVICENMKAPHISLSHTDQIGAVAISHREPIGIDIEKWSIRDFDKIAEYAFGPCERQEVAQHGKEAFYRIWTVREAAAKCGKNTMLSAMNGTDQASDIKAGAHIYDGKHVEYQVVDGLYSLAVVMLTV